MDRLKLTVFQCQQHFFSGFKTRFGFSRNCLEYDIFQPAWYFWPVARWRNWLAKSRRLEWLDLAVRVTPGQHMIKRDTSGINITAGVCHRAFKQFWCHETGRARVLHGLN